MIQVAALAIQKPLQFDRVLIFQEDVITTRQVHVLSAGDTTRAYYLTVNKNNRSVSSKQFTDKY